jgi:hypothetical protein
LQAITSNYKYIYLQYLNECTESNVKKIINDTYFH